jgi:uncharacterized RDD family membrane protein YckC
MTAPPPYAAPPYRDDAFEAALTWHVLRRRVAAALVDLLLCGIAIGLFVLFSVVLGVLTLGLGFGALALLPAVPVLYNWFFATWMSATPGQRLMGLALRRNDTLGPPGPAEALVWALGFALTLALTFGLLWLLVVLLTERKRALHDIVAGLVVVRAATLTGPPPSWNMPRGGHPAP